MFTAPLDIILNVQLLCYVVLCCVMLLYVVLCCFMLCYVALCCVVLLYVVLCCFMLCYVALCCAVLDVLSCVELWSVMLYSTIKYRIANSSKQSAK